MTEMEKRAIEAVIRAWIRGLLRMDVRRAIQANGAPLDSLESAGSRAIEMERRFDEFEREENAGQREAQFLFLENYARSTMGSSRYESLVSKAKWMTGPESASSSRSRQPIYQPVFYEGSQPGPSAPQPPPFGPGENHWRQGAQKALPNHQQILDPAIGQDYGTQRAPPYRRQMLRCFSCNEEGHRSHDCPNKSRPYYQEEQREPRVRQGLEGRVNEQASSDPAKG